MSSLACPCGNILYDKSDRVPYDSGTILCDDDEREFIDGVSMRLAQFIQAIQEGKRDAWIQSQPHLGQNPDSVNDSDAEIIDWVMTTVLNDYTRVVDQCPVCGRLLVQERPYHQMYYPFAPESTWQGLLSDVGPIQEVPATPVAPVAEELSQEPGQVT